MKNNSKISFKGKLVLFFAFSMILPIIYLSLRFNLFKVQNSLSIWAFFVIVIFALVLMFMIKYYLDGMKTKYSFLKQLLQGLIKVVFPLLIVLIGLIIFKNKLGWLSENVGLMIEAIAIILGCETIAIIVNPLPKWAFENNVEGLTEIVEKVLKKGE